MEADWIQIEADDSRVTEDRVGSGPGQDTGDMSIQEAGAGTDVVPGAGTRSGAGLARGVNTVVIDIMSVVSCVGACRIVLCRVVWSSFVAGQGGSRGVQCGKRLQR